MRPTVGETVWVFDENRRVYRKGQSSPIYREYFVPHRIVDETAVSWILDCGTKINKKTKESSRDSRGYRKRIYDESQVNDSCFIHDERYRISEAVMDCVDVPKLRQIAAILQAPAQPVGGSLAVDPVAQIGQEAATREKKN